MDNSIRNGQPAGPLQGYSAQLVVDEAVHWLSDVRARDKPFFLFVCFHDSHEPIATDPQFACLYPSPGDPTLSAHHGNISQTAESLFVHRNTLLYRMDRIQELTGQDLNNADMRLALHLSLKLWQLRHDTTPPL